MSRSAPGGASADNLHTTVTAYNSGPYSFVTWAKSNSNTNDLARLLHVGSGTSGQLLYVPSGGNGESLNYEQQYATSQVVYSHGGTQIMAVGSWKVLSVAYDGADLGGTSPALITSAAWNGHGLTSGLHRYPAFVNTVGSGARTTGLTDFYLLNRLSGLNRCFNGELFALAWLPWMISPLEVEMHRRGRLSYMTMRGTPLAFFGLEGSDLNSYPGIGPSLSLTASGTTSTSDPIAIDTDNGVTGYSRVEEWFKNDSFSSSGTYTTGTITPPSGTTRCIVIVSAKCPASIGDPVISISDSLTHSWSTIIHTSNNSGSGDQGITAFSCTNTGTSPFTVGVTAGGRTVTSYQVHVIFLSGTAGAPTIGQTAVNNGQSTTPTVTLGGAPAASSLVIAAITSDGDGANTTDPAAGMSTVTHSHPNAAWATGVGGLVAITGVGVETAYAWDQANFSYAAIAFEVVDNTGASGASVDLLLESYNNAHSSSAAYTTGTATPSVDDKLLVVVAAYETSSTSTVPDITCSDSQGHVWTKEIIALGDVAITPWGQSVAIFTAPNASATGFTVTVDTTPTNDVIASWKVVVLGVQGTNPSVGQAKGRSGYNADNPTLILDDVPLSDSVVIAALVSDEDSTAANVTPTLTQISESDVSPVLNIQNFSSPTQTYSWSTANVHEVMAAIEILNDSPPTIFTTGYVTKVGTKALTAGNTPAGAITRLTAKALTAGVTPGAVLVKQTNKLLAGAITPTGALTADFLSGAPLVGTPIIAQIMRRAVAGRRPFNYHEYAQRNYWDSPKFIDVQLAGAITPGAGTLTKITTKPLAGAITPGAGTIVKQTNKALTAGITPTGALTKQTSKNLAGGLTPTGALTKVLSRTLTGAITPSGAVAKQDNKVTSGGVTPTGEVDQTTVAPLTGTITPTGAVTKLVNKNLAGGLTPSGALTTDFINGSGLASLPHAIVQRLPYTHYRRYRYEQIAQRNYWNSPKFIDVALSGSITPTGALTKVVTKTLTGGITPTGALTKTTNKALTAGITPSATLTRLVSKNLAGTITPTGALTKVFSRSLSGSAGTPSGVITKVTAKALTAGITPGPGSITKVTVKALDGALVPTGALTKLVLRSLAGAITPTGVLTTVTVHSITLSGTITPTGVITKVVTKTLTGGITPTGALTKLVTRTLTGGITPSSSVANATLYARSLSGSLTPGPGALTKVTNKALTAGITPSATLTRLVSKNLAGSITPTGQVDAQTTVPLTGSIATSGAITKVTVKTLTGGITPSGALTTDFINGSGLASRPLAIARRRVVTHYRRWRYEQIAQRNIPSNSAVTNVALDGTITTSGAVTRQANKALTAGITPSGTIVKLVIRSLAGSISSSGDVATSRVGIARSFDGTISSSGAITRQVNKALTAGITPAGAVTRLTAKALTASIAPSGALSKVTVKTLAGAIVPGPGTVTSVSVHTLTLAGTITPTGSVSRQTNKALASTVTPAGALHKVVSRALGGSISPAATLARLTRLTLSGSTTPSGSVSAEKSSALTGTLSPTGTLTRLVLRTLASTVVPAGSVTRSVSVALDGSVSTDGSVATAELAEAVLSGVVALSGALTAVKIPGGGPLPPGYGDGHEADERTDTIRARQRGARVSTTTRGGARGVSERSGSTATTTTGERSRSRSSDGATNRVITEG